MGDHPLPPHSVSSKPSLERTTSLARQPSVEIDDSLYSRQRYVLGDEAMKQMHRASVLIVGLGGVGVEVAKNLILGGVRKVFLWDDRPSNWTDLSGNYCITEEDVKDERLRVDACVAKLRELNPGVTVEVLYDEMSVEYFRGIHRQFNCVIVTEIALSKRIEMNKILRSDAAHHIPFISADAFGIFAGMFCDFGDRFQVLDPRAEEGRELLVASITNENNGIVTCQEGYFHRLEAGDLVEFKDVQGMVELNGKAVKVEKVVSPLVFTIGETSQFTKYDQGGIAKQYPNPIEMSFKSMESTLYEPQLLDCELARMNAAKECHLAWLIIMTFLEKHARLPKPGMKEDLALAAKMVEPLITSFPVEDLDEQFLVNAVSASTGQLNPLVATIGGFVAQEAMKALTGKFTPLQQYLYFDARNVYSPHSRIENDRYDGIRICIGQKALDQLKSLKVFMVGCGAIGCEMLKNLALIGACCGTGGRLHITDDDRIEKSNLNRQFLFRPEHITKSKSEVAAERIKLINAEINIVPHILRVSPATQHTPFSDEFFHHQDVIVNALDNVQARLYVDQRCVTTGKPLLDSGTLSTKGHVQVVVPYLTESYGTQRDPAENAGDSIPFCTLKQFPALIEHCIEWAREKFQSSFAAKPDQFNTFWQQHGPAGQLLRALEEQRHIEGITLVNKLITVKPKNVHELVTLARHKFEKYFSFKAQHLLKLFPLDHLVEGGIKFWTSPKRPPKPVVYDAENPVHFTFVKAAVVLYARIYGLDLPAADLSSENIKALSKKVSVPKFVPHGKPIEEKADENRAPPISAGEEADKLKKHLRSSLQKGDCQPGDNLEMFPEGFEKDDDSNSHIDYIYAAANLRAEMYRIDRASRIHTKRIAGRIVPAIATTTACVSGLATLELLKLAGDREKMTHASKHLLDDDVLAQYKNTFLNLALPVMYFSEPGKAAKTVLPGGVTVTLWDQWSIQGNKSFTMQNFIDEIKNKYNLDASSILLGAKMVYMPFMPDHKKRLNQPFHNYLDLPEKQDYVDLSVDMDVEDDDAMNGESDMVMWPPVRYYFR